MSCCGRRSNAVAPPTLPVSSAKPTSPHPTFQYLGASGLTVQGPATKRLYRFPRAGATVTVDARDAASLSRVPHLRRV